MSTDQTAVNGSVINGSVINVSVVIPVYRGEDTLPAIAQEIAQLHTPTHTPQGRRFQVSELLLVWDHGPGASDKVIRQLAREHSFIRPIWLSRNFGQHAATLAGMTSSSGEWILTMDEDGQHDPAFIGAMLDSALDARAQLVYGAPTNPPPHGAFRNFASKITKAFYSKFLANGVFPEFNSFRLVQGEVGRSVAAFTGTGVYLDVALNWVVSDTTTCSVNLRNEGRDASNYSLRRLFSHFGRLIVSSGTKPLLFVSWLGVIFVVIGGLTSLFILSQRIFGNVPVGGWSSMIVALMVIGGAILLSLGIIAQYVGAATNMSLGKPLYIVTRDPASTFDTPEP